MNLQTLAAIVRVNIATVYKERQQRQLAQRANMAAYRALTKGTEQATRFAPYRERTERR